MRYKLYDSRYTLRMDDVKWFLGILVVIGILWIGGHNKTLRSPSLIATSTPKTQTVVSNKRPNALVVFLGGLVYLNHHISTRQNHVSANFDDWAGNVLVTNQLKQEKLASRIFSDRSIYTFVDSYFKVHRLW